MIEYKDFMNRLSEIAGCIWYVDNEGVTHIEYSVPEPPNPFTPVPEDRPEDWRDDGEDEDD